MKKEEMLKKAIKIHYDDTNIPLFKGIFIIQERKLHDSGYRLMNVIGHTEYYHKLNDFKYYLISECSDVVDFTPIFEKLLAKQYDMCDLHLDISSNGVIHIWTNSNRYLKMTYPNVSSCSFEIV